MYPLKPMAVFVQKSALDDPRHVARLDRMLDAMDISRSDITLYDDDTVVEVVAALRDMWPPEGQSMEQCMFARPLVFNCLDLDETMPDLTDLLARCPERTSEHHVRTLLGQIKMVNESHPYEKDAAEDMVCWHTHDFGTLTGCPHSCAYCGTATSAKAITIGLNLEDYMDRIVGPAVERDPWHRCFRMIDWGTDYLPFEPEYGCLGLFAEKLAEYDDRWGYFHTAASNVDWLKDLPHRDRLIGVWSVTNEQIVKDLEPGFGTAHDRFEAGRKCRQMGLAGVRFKFKPTIPITGWKEHYAAAIEDMFSTCVPESIGFGVMMWHDVNWLTETFDEGIIDEACLRAARESAEEMKSVRTGPFPHETRKAIYEFLIGEVRKHNQDVKLYLSTESRRMWDELADALGQDPRAYVCACSSVATPGQGLVLTKDCPHSTYMPLEAAAD